MKFYLTKIAKYQKDAAGFIEFLNSMVKYEKKALTNFPLNRMLIYEVK